MSHRSTSDDSSGDASRRMKTELLIQMDGLSSLQSAQVFVLAASNLPWDLDNALLRRLEKRIYVPLPKLEARKLMCLRLLKEENRTADEVDFDLLARKTEGYSGADLTLLCQ